MPKVSVIIPNYNHARFLEKRITSVLNQTFQDIEVILMDDKSTDNSLEIIERYRTHPKVSNVIINRTNGGSTFLQWSKGLEQAKGEYVWIAESDDYAEVSFLTELVAALDAHPNATIGFCDLYWVDQAGAMIRRTQAIEEYNNEVNEIDGNYACKAYFLHKNIIPNVSAALFRKDTFSEELHQIPFMKLAGDWLLYVKLARGSSLIYLRKALSYYRLHSQTVRSTYATSLPALLEMKLVVRYIIASFDIKKNEIPKGQYNYFVECWLSAVELVGINILNPHFFKLLRFYPLLHTLDRDLYVKICSIYKRKLASIIH